MSEANKSKLVAPTIHLNGSGRQSLEREYADSINAIRKAIGAIPAPHERDYYVKPGSFEVAKVQFNSWIKRLNQIETELTSILEQIEE